MPIREPRKVKVLKNGRLYHEFRSVRDLIRFFMKYSEISYHSAKSRINEACRENDGFILDLRFVKDPNYVTSRLVFAINPITGDYLTFPSVGKAGAHIFGRHDIQATSKITKLCQSGEAHDATGLVFKHIENGYVFSANICNRDRSRAILQLDRYTGTVINYFHSISAAADYIFNLDLTELSVVNIATKISSCANEKSPAESAPFGFKWRYVRHDEPAENVPLPRPNSEGL